MLAALPNDPAVAFAAGDGRAERSPRQALRETLTAMPKMVAFGEAAGQEKELESSAPVNFAAPRGTLVDAAQAKAHAKAQKLAQACSPF